MWIGLFIVLAHLTVITLVFARIGRLKDQLDSTESWDPRELAAMPELRESIPRSEAVASLLMMIFWLLWWTDALPINRWLLGDYALAPAPIWAALSPLIITLMAAGIAIEVVAIVRPRWVRLYDGAGLLIDVGIAVMLFQALRAPELVVVGDPTAAGANLAGLVNWGLFIALLVWAAIVVISLTLAVRRLVASARLGKHASVAVR